MSSKINAFAHFGLDKNILNTLSDLGYEKATPVQEQGIPILLNGEDLLAQAQTGTGKTATFALPILSRLNPEVRAPQALVLVPTRELAIQVAEAFQSYAKQVPRFSVTPIYGGQDFNTQLRSLKRGSQVIVGTPGRLMDHMRRKTLPLDALQTVVLDEADEMLKMGFADDVEWILGELKAPHQTALFSATMSSSIQKIAQRYLKDAKKIQIKSQTNTVEAIEQCYVTVSNRNQKLDVLTRLLEVEENQAVIIFTRTKTESTELAERLQARGHSAAALNGDMTQGAREKTINRLKKGDLDILIATDVAARGIDVERVTHVINYDIPHDVDSYVHRIGRTGRAGRTGKAILFVTPRETRLLKDIEHHINKSIKRIEPPSLKVIREKRATQLGEKIAATMKEKKAQLAPYIELVMTLTDQHACSAKDVAAALMLLSEEQNTSTDNFETTSSEPERSEKRHYGKRTEERRAGGFSRGGSGAKGAPNRSDRGDRFERSDRPKFERTERTDRPRFEGAERPKFDRKDRPEKFERTERSERPKFDKKDRPEKFERTERSDRPKYERAERPKFEKSERSFGDAKSSKAPRDFKDAKKSRSYDGKTTPSGKPSGDRPNASKRSFKR